MKGLYLFLMLAFGISTHSIGQPGTLDPSFGNAGKVITSLGPNNAFANAIAVQSDGKILVAGETYTNNTILEDFALVRYNTDGTLDANFGTNGLVITDLQQATDVAKAIAIQPDGKILLAGYSDNTFNYDFAIVRYLPNGTLDNTFGTSGKVIKNFGSTDFGLAMALLPNGKILVSGRAYNGSNSDFALVQLNANGSFDNSFGTGGAILADLFGEDESANALAVQADGKIVLAGDRYANNTSLFAIARFNPDGSLDPGFSFDGKLSTSIGPESDVIYGVAIQADGKIVVAGQSNLPAPSISDFALARYMPDGTPDNTFDGDGQLTSSPSSGGDYAFAIAIQSDGKIVVGGISAGSNSISDFAVIRYLPNGNLDASFGNAGIAKADFNTGRDAAYAMLLNQNKILMAGYSDKNAKSTFAVTRFLGDVSVAVADIASAAVELFPNPASSYLSVTILGEAAGFAEVFSATGQLMAKLPITAKPLEINVSGWSNGMYFVTYLDKNRGRNVATFWVQRP